MPNATRRLTACEMEVAEDKLEVSKVENGSLKKVVKLRNEGAKTRIERGWGQSQRMPETELHARKDTSIVSNGSCTIFSGLGRYRGSLLLLSLYLASRGGLNLGALARVSGG
jgi:hypothetical protein